MKGFIEWVEENHPEDELVNEFLGDMASRMANSKLGRAAAVAGALALGVAGKADAAMPMPVNVTQQGDHSDRPFDKQLIVSMAKEMGLNPKKVSEMSDFDAWHLVMKKIRSVEDEMSRINTARQRGGMVGKKEWPRWYIKFATHHHWKAPKAPEVK